VEKKLPNRRAACRHAVITDRSSSNLFLSVSERIFKVPLEEFQTFYQKILNPEKKDTM
jgi:hypothetical protein